MTSYDTSQQNLALIASKERTMSDNLCRYRAIRNGLRQFYVTEPKGNVARHLDAQSALITSTKSS
jgi:hypothetical protein